MQNETCFRCAEIEKYIRKGHERDAGEIMDPPFLFDYQLGQCCEYKRPGGAE